MKYILIEDNHLYYIGEGEATIHLENATTYISLEDIFTKVPIMRDWNWSYEIFTLENDSKKLVDEFEWCKIYKEMKDNNLLYEQNNKVISAFTRKIFIN